MDIDVPNRGQILSKRFLTCYSLKTIQLQLTTVNRKGELLVIFLRKNSELQKCHKITCIFLVLLNYIL